MRLFRRKSERIPTTPCLVKLSPIQHNDTGSGNNGGILSGSIVAVSENKDSTKLKITTTSTTTTTTPQTVPGSGDGTGTGIIRPTNLPLNLKGNNRTNNGDNSPKTPIKKGMSLTLLHYCYYNPEPCIFCVLSLQTSLNITFHVVCVSG